MIQRFYRRHESARVVTAVALLLLLALLAWGVETARAQDDGGAAAGLPAWYDDIAIAGFALAPLTTVIVQILKIFLARLGLPEGYSGYLTIAVAMVLIAVAVGAGVLGVEEDAAAILTAVHRVAEALLTILGAVGWYRVGQHMKVMPAVGWEEKHIA